MNDKVHPKDALEQSITVTSPNAGPRPRVLGAKPGLFQGMAAGVPFVGEPPDKDSSLSYRMGHMLTESIISGMGIAKGATFVPKAAETASKGVRLASDIVQGLSNAYKTSKLRLAATEGTMGLGAGAGGHYAVQNFPDSGIAQFVFEMGGGMAADFVPGALKLSATKLPTVLGLNYIRNNTRPGQKLEGFVQDFRKRADPTFASGRARDRFARQGITEPDAQQIITDVENLREGDELLPGAAERMSFATLSGNRGLLQLEKDVMEAAKSDSLSMETTRKLQELNEIVHQGFDLNGDADALFNFMKQQEEYYGALLAANLEAAAKDTDGRLKKFAVDATKEEQANLIVRSSLDKAMESAKKTERALWKAIPNDVVVPTEEFAKKWMEIKGDMTQVTKGTDQPWTAQWLNSIPYGKKKDTPRIGEWISIQEARDMIGKLREEARNATSAFGETNWNKARLANELAESMNKDLEAALDGYKPGIKETVAQAVAFTKEFSKQYRNPTIAGLFARNETGQRVIKDTEVLQHLFSNAGRNRGNYDDLMNVVGNDPVVSAALEDYLRFSMFNYETFNREAAERFLKDNERLLDRMPNFKKEIEEAIRIDDEGLATLKNIEADFEPIMAAATVFLKKEPVKAVAEVFNGQAQPVRKMAQLLDLARQDESGAALLGVQDAFSQYLLDVSTSGSQFQNTGGLRYVDYNLLEETLRKPAIADTLSMVFDENQMRRWNQLRATAKRIQLQADAPKTEAGIDEDLASKILTTAARIGGARLGGDVIAGASLGSSLQTASIISGYLSEMARSGIEKPSQELIKMAVLNENLFKVLFKKTSDPEVIESNLSVLDQAVKYAINKASRGAGQRTGSVETLLVEPMMTEEQQQ